MKFVFCLYIYFLNWPATCRHFTEIYYYLVLVSSIIFFWYIFLRIWIWHDYIQATATFHHLIVSAGAPSGFFSVTTYTYFNDISFSIWFPLKVNSFQWSVLLMDVCVCCTLCRIFVSKIFLVNHRMHCLIFIFRENTFLKKDIYILII